MLRRFAILLALTAIAALGVSGCGDDGGDDSSEEAATATAEDEQGDQGEEGEEDEGEPISEPICDFLGLSADDAAAVVGFEVTTASSVGENDPSGGSCTLTPQSTSSDSFEIVVVVFPDTEENFTSFLERHTEEPGPSGELLFTEPVELSGIGDVAYTFQSPDGGFDNVWVFTNGYRLLVTDQNTADIPEAAEKLEALAQELAPKV